jgi:uncharacterized membrane protein
MDAFLMLLRWLHFLFGITWIGLLYYMNFVQTPYFGEVDPPVRSVGQQKLLPRALWWFRWGAMGTVIAGVLYLFIWWSRAGWSFNSWAVAILTGGTLGIIMWANVWFVIWPKQQIVIANAAAVAGGAQANPAAAPAGRRAAITSRTNVLFSIPMLFFMGAANHYPLFGEPKAAGIAAWIILCGAIIAAIEINALVGTQGPTKKPLDTISGVIWSGFIVWAILTAIIMMVL